MLIPWIAFQGVRAGMTNSRAAVGPAPAQGYQLIENGQVKPLSLAFDAQNNLVNSNLDGIPIKGLYDTATGKLTFFATTNPLPILTIDSFFAYLVVNTHNGVSTLLLAGVVNRIVVNITGGTATSTTTESGWWAFPNPV